jgi:Skp family chaperone for outer membrane proteins
MQGVLNVKTSLCFAALAAAVLACGFAASPALGQTGGTAVAVIDVPYIFKNHIRFQQQIEDIKKDIDAYKDIVTQQQTQLRTESEKLNQFRAGTQEYKDVEENIARLRVEFQLDSNKRQKDFMEREAKVYFNVYREVEAAVADFAARNRVGLVLRYSAEEMDPTKRDSIMQGINRIVIYQNRLNITDLILENLNRGTPASVPSTATPGIAPPLPRR